MKKVILLLVPTFIMLYSCNNAKNGGAVRTFHPATAAENDYYDKVYDPVNNVIFYIDKNRAINYGADGEEIIIWGVSV